MFRSEHAGPRLRGDRDPHHAEERRKPGPAGEPLPAGDDPPPMVRSSLFLTNSWVDRLAADNPCVKSQHAYLSLFFFSLFFSGARG